MADYSQYHPAPSDGVTRGDDKAIPNAGTSRGFVNVGNDTYGADVSVGATNRMGPADGTQSDPAEMRFPKGDEDRFTSSMGKHGDDPGTGMGDVAKSDAPDDETPVNPKQ